jgi:hypothetical protein
MLHIFISLKSSTYPPPISLRFSHYGFLLAVTKGVLLHCIVFAYIAGEGTAPESESDGS